MPVQPDHQGSQGVRLIRSQCPRGAGLRVGPPISGGPTMMSLLHFLLDLVRTLADGLTRSGYLPSPVDED